MEQRRVTDVVKMRRRTASPAMSDVMDTMMDMMNQWNEALYGPMMDMWEEMAQPFTQMLTPTRQPMTRRRHGYKHKYEHDCGCEHCGRDDCNCRCCVYDADLVVYTRVAELRVVPLMIENSRRREREVKVSISEFSCKDKDVNVSGLLLEPTTFKLGPCEEQEVILVVRSAPKTDKPTPAPNPNEPGSTPTTPNRPADVANAVIGTRRIDVPDVEECTVCYADLRVEGCDMRPIRIAVAILPRDCDPYEIDCHCGCC
jgi:hypothetical protein